MSIVNGQTASAADFNGISFGYGDGSDGAVNMDGSNTFASFASKVGSVYTLLRDIYPTTLTIGTGVTLRDAGYSIRCSVAITGVGILDTLVPNNGSAGGASAGGAPGAAQGGKLKSQAGQIGANQTGIGNAGNGGNSTSSTVSPGATGGVGGGGTGNVSSGVNGTAVANTTNIKFGVFRDLVMHALDIILSTGATLFIVGSGGGGGGGGGTAGGGGGGGEGGGIHHVWAPLWSGSFTIKAIGGNGGNGTNQGGPGGGGAGGVSIFCFGTKTWTGSYTLTAGTPGTGGATAGTSGSTGVSFEIQIKTLT